MLFQIFQWLARVQKIRAVVVVFVLGSSFTPSIAQTVPAVRKIEPVKGDRRLEIIEELSESLANELLELSVAERDRDLTLWREYVPAP